MKLSYNVATTAENATLEEDLEFCEKYGYAWIEIQTGKMKSYLERHSLEELARWFAEHTLKPLTLNAIWGYDFVDESGWAETMKNLDFLLEVGKAIHCNTLITVPAFGLGVSKTITEIREEEVKRIRMMDQHCRTYGWPMRFALEFCGSPACCVNQLGSAYDIAVATGLPNVGVTLDCFHFYTMGSSYEDIERMEIDRLFVLHMDDSEELPVGAGSDKERLWPGDGCIDLNRILSKLWAKGYDGAASVELFRPEYYKLPPEDTIRIAGEKTKAVLSAYWDIE